MPKKHTIIDLRKVIQEQAPPEEIAERERQIQKLTQDRVILEKQLTDKYQKADAKARDASDQCEKMAEQLKQIKFDFDEYKKSSGKEIQRLRKDLDEAEGSKGQEG